MRGVHMADVTREDETEAEREQADETGETPDEAHRAGEFGELRDLLMSVRDEIAGLRSAIADMMAGRPGEAEPDVPDDSDDDGRDLIDIDQLDL